MDYNLPHLPQFYLSRHHCTFTFPTDVLETYDKAMGRLEQLSLFSLLHGDANEIAYRSSTEWPVSAAPGGWLPAFYHTTPTADHFDRPRTYVRGSKNSHKPGRSIIHCCWTTSMEPLTLLKFYQLLKTHLYSEDLGA